MENKVINLFTKGEVNVQDRKFTRLVGGFGEDNPVISVKQIAELAFKANVRDNISKAQASSLIEMLLAC